MVKAEIASQIAREVRITNQEVCAAKIQTPKDTIIDPVDIKGELTERELKFIQLHIVLNVPVKSALILSGYPDDSEQHAFVVGRKIVSKYEHSGEAREIFSDLNFGPVEIARGIIAIATTCPNQQVRLNALPGSVAITK